MSAFLIDTHALLWLIDNSPASCLALIRAAPIRHPDTELILRGACATATPATRGGV